MRIFFVNLIAVALLGLSAGHAYRPMAMGDMTMQGMVMAGTTLTSMVSCSMDGCLEPSVSTRPYVSCLEHCLAASKQALPNALPNTSRTTGIVFLFGLAALFAYVKPRVQRFTPRFTLFGEPLHLQQLATVVLRD